MSRSLKKHVVLRLFALITLAVLLESAQASEPTWIESIGLTFPADMRRWGVTGDANFVMYVDATGKPTEIQTRQSPHPSFELASIKALIRGRFGITQREKVKLPGWFSIPIRFRFNGSEHRENGGEAAFSFPEKSRADAPAQFQYDRPPVINWWAAVVYPYERFTANDSGSAKVAVVLDSKGLVRTVLVTEATHPEFGEALKAALFASSFQPAMKDGQATMTAFTYQQKFRKSERDTGVTNETRALLNAMSDNAVVEETALDRKLAARHRPNPVDHRERRAETGSEETVVVEFYVDREGGVQLPRIVSAKNAELGWAAATALKRWVFEVPTVKGEAVFARKEMQVTFK